MRVLYRNRYVLASVRLGAHVGVASLGIRCLAAGLNLETGQLSRLIYSFEISLNVTLNHNQSTDRPVRLKWLSQFFSTYVYYIHHTCTTSSSWHDIQMPYGGLCP